MTDPIKNKLSNLNLDQIMTGDEPAFLVHRSYNGDGRLDEVFNELLGAHGSSLGIGTVVRMPSIARKKVEAYLGRHSDLPLRIADPEIFNARDTKWTGASAKKTYEQWDYLDDVPTKPNHLWVKNVLQIQRDVGATVLLSATGWVDETEADRSLRESMDFVAESRNVAQDDYMFVNLSMDSRWLTESSLRARLLQEIVESNEQRWYLRFYWPEVSPRYGQLSDVGLLMAYKELATVCAVEGKQLYVPNTGLTGWIATAMGAKGFSTGPSWPEQAFARQRVIAGRKGQTPPPRIPRFYSSTLLHTIEYTEQQRLASFPEHVAPGNIFANEISAEGHDATTAGLHYLMEVGALQASLNMRRPNIKGLIEVRRAQAFLEALHRVDQPAGPNKPTHLAAWESLLN
jgi:hypothetical protein